VNGRNVAIESHWAYGQADRLPALAADLLQRQPFVMFVAGTIDPSIPAIRALNPTVPGARAMLTHSRRCYL
jgi:putative ABC transport system substrate-binding protein